MERAIAKRSHFSNNRPEKRSTQRTRHFETGAAHDVLQGRRDSGFASIQGQVSSLRRIERRAVGNLPSLEHLMYSEAQTATQKHRFSELRWRYR